MKRTVVNREIHAEIECEMMTMVSMSTSMNSPESYLQTRILQILMGFEWVKKGMTAKDR